MTERESEFYDLYLTLISYAKPQLLGPMKERILCRLKALNADVTDVFVNSKADVVVCKDKLQSWYALDSNPDERNWLTQQRSFELWLLY